MSTEPAIYATGLRDGRNIERAEAVAHLHRQADHFTGDTRDVVLLLAASLNGGDHIGGER